MRTIYAVMDSTDFQPSFVKLLCSDKEVAEHIAFRNGDWGGDCSVQEMTVFDSADELKEAGFTFKGPAPWRLSR